MTIVSNTTPIISFLKINRMDILEKMFNIITIPQAVYEEITVKRQLDDEINIFNSCNFIKVRSVNNEFAVNLLRKQSGLGLGESEAITLAEDLKEAILLIDELKGRKVAEQNGINIIGTIGIIVKAKKLGYINQAKPLLDELITKNIRISKELYNNILNLINER